MAFRLLHTADLHLGKSFRELPPERAGQRRADLLATLQRICFAGREHQVDLLCITGDFFDRLIPAPPLLASVRAALAEATVPVLLVPGNHDPLDPGSPYLENRWPGNVNIANAPGWQRMPAIDLEIWAFGYVRGAAHHSPWEAFPGCGSEALLALHAACLAPSLAVDAGYYAFSPPQIPACAYLALGHHHRPEQVNRNPMAWYAGAPEALEADVTPAATLLVTLDGGSTTVEPLDLATRRHRLVTLSVDGLHGDAVWERALAEAAMDDLLYLKLTGMLEAAESLDIPALRAELSTRCFAAEVDTGGLHLPGLAENQEGAAGLLQQLAQARKKELLLDDPQCARLDRAVRYAALALEGRL